jgi:hypothetical protein
MKALRWHARKDLRYEDVPEPSPGPRQLNAVADEVKRLR